MTEKTTTKGPVRLLSDCARLAGFDPADGWPGELPERGIINLLGRKEWAKLVSAAIKHGDLVTFETSTTTPGKTVKVGSLPGYGRFNHWATGLDPQTDYTLPPETIVTRHIKPAALATWLKAIGETTDTLSACALAWMGPEWKEAATEAITSKPGVNKGEEKSLTDVRIAAILEIAKGFKYDPKQIPWGGKAAIARECLNRTGEPWRFTEATFEKAWKAAKKAEIVEVENVETYRGE